MSRKEMPVIISGGTESAQLAFLTEQYPSGDHQFIAVSRKGNGYGIEDIRIFKEQLTLQSVGTSKRVYYFLPADSMTDVAQQSLLLLLEELPKGVLLVFLVSRPNVLLPTIVSRARVVQIDHVAGNSQDLSTLTLPQTMTIEEAMSCAKDYTEKQEVLSLIEELLRVLRRERREHISALRYLLKLSKDLQTTSLAPRFVAELALLTFVRAR